jgi:Zn-dependent peptidase ImmA (M78 family)
MFETTLKKPDYRHAEREATRLLNAVGIYQPPVNPLEIAKFLGVKVSFVRFTGESEQVAGLFDFKTDTIMVNKEEAGVRQTFTVAHELGHKVLHQDWAASDAYKVLWRDPSRGSSDRREKEANVFAASLLMPRQMVREYRHLDIASLSSLFAVSEQVVTNRLQNLSYGF